MTGLTFNDIACTRGGRLLFDGISRALDPGAALRVTGPNGVGKSSLLRLAAGLLRPSAGTIHAIGRIALADEHPALEPGHPLGQALGFWAGLDGGTVTTALAAVDLVHLRDVPVRMLSTGQRRRATFARVIASGADIWLLDEPANGLDIASVTMLEGVIAVHRARGGIVAVASHQSLTLPDAQRLALGA